MNHLSPLGSVTYSFLFVVFPVAVGTNATGVKFIMGSTGLILPVSIAPAVSNHVPRFDFDTICFIAI